MSLVDLSTITDAFTNEDFGDEKDPVDDLQHTIPQSLPIYGRRQEQRLLLQTYEITAQTRKSQTVFVHGFSGFGKTALVRKFHKKVCENGGLFCTGKYFQNSSVQEPYSAIMAAFSDLCDLVIQSEDFNDERKQQISRDIGQNAHMLRKVISNVSPLLDSTILNEAPITESKTEAAMTLFKIACKAFLRAIASGKQPVVVFLDDIQWMDTGSRLLIEMYLSDTEMKNVVFILAYRDEEQAIVGKALSNVNTDNVVDIQLGNLTAEGVATLVSRLFQSPPGDSKTKALSALVYQKTNGNPFHVVHFMDVIQWEELVVYNSDSNCWEFDVDTIRKEVMVADSAAELLLRKMKLLPLAEQETLKIASLLGYHFDNAILFDVVHRERSQRNDITITTSAPATSSRSSSLEEAFKLGLVERTGDSSNFPHDMIQSAFQSMLDDREEKKLQLIIGEVYLALDREDAMYHAAVHFNQAKELIQDRQGRLKLARINLEAATYSRGKSAFDIAAELLRQGLSILGDKGEKWTVDFELAFEMTESLARMELTIGNLSSCRQLTQEALRRATSLDMKIDSLLVSVECELAGNETNASIATAFEVLRCLGIRMPRRVSIRHMLFKFAKVRRMLRKLKDEDILQLPPIQDRRIETAGRILINLCGTCFVQNKANPAVYSALVAAELTLLHGLSPHSATALVVYAAAELIFQNYKRAYRFGKLGMQLLDRVKNKSTECSAICSWVAVLGHWTESIEDLRKPILRAINSGFDSGDVVYTPIALATFFTNALCVGDNLRDTEQFMRKAYSTMCDLSGDLSGDSMHSMRMLVLPLFQATLNYQCELSEWIDLTRLSGEMMVEEEHFRQHANKSNGTTLWFVKTLLAYDFGFPQLAQQWLEMSMPTDIEESILAMQWQFNGSLIYYERYRDTGKRMYLKKARKLRRYLEQVQARGNPNVSFVSILQAEEGSIQKSSTVEFIASAYDSAIAIIVAKGKQARVEAMANERAGLVLAKLGCHAQAKPYLERAMWIYRHQWGATAKFEWLQEVSSHFLYQPHPEGHNPRGEELVGEVLLIGGDDVPAF